MSPTEPPSDAPSTSIVGGIEVIYIPAGDRAWDVVIPSLDNRHIGQVQRHDGGYYFSDGPNPGIESAAPLSSANSAVGFYTHAHPELLAP